LLLVRKWLIEARRDATQEEIARLVGIQRQYYGMTENGNRRPSVAVAKKIVAVLGFEWTIFLTNWETI